jgi:hypothetical protein
MGDVQAVRKTDRNAQQNFNFRGIDAVVNAVGPALRAHSVFIVPRQVKAQREVVQTKSGASMMSVVVSVVYRWFGPDGDWIDTHASGEAFDSGDKATAKAMSVAYRTLLLQALCIPTDEPDPDSTTYERLATAVSTAEAQARVPLPLDKTKHTKTKGPDTAVAEPFLDQPAGHLPSPSLLREMYQAFQAADIPEEHRMDYTRDTVARPEGSAPILIPADLTDDEVRKVTHALVTFVAGPV